MLMLQQSRPYFRFLSLVTILTFFPSSIAVWNFVPPSWDVVEAQDVADNDGTATDATLDESPLGLPPKILTQEELAAISGGPAAGATGHAATPASNRLPEMKIARSLPKPPAIITDPDAASVPAEPIRLAQAGDPVQPAGLDAQLAAADIQRDAGNLADAYLGYVGVLNDYPEAWLQGAIDARDRIKDMAKTLSEAEFQALNEIARDFTLLNGPLAVRGTNEFYRAWAEACKEREDLDGWRWRTQEVMARTMWGMVRYPNDLDVRRLFSWYISAANDLDMRVEGEETLKDYLLKQEPSVVTFEGWARLSENAADYRDYGQGIICAANALGSVDTVDTVLNNPAELQKEKAWLAYRVGKMYEFVGLFDDALAQYRDLQTRYPVPEALAASGNAVYDAGIREAQMIARMNPNDLYQGVLAYHEFIQRYPNGPLKSQARFEMAGLYTLAGDYRQAASLYRELLQDYPGQAEQVWPELDFILTYLYDSVEVASGQPVASPEQTKLAQMCGPSALQKLLKTQGVEVSQDELAELAGTDETGTTMLGLVEAAKAKGVELAGVQAPEADGLPQPFIAYVNQNHFLVVREVRPDSVVILDLDKPETALTRAEFARIWDGMALVRADATPQLARLLNLEAQKGAKGGCGGTPPPPPVPPPCDEDSCECGDNGDGNPPNGPTPFSSTAGSPSSPRAKTGIGSPGVTASVYPSSTTFKLDETDLAIPVRGDNDLAFRRVLVNEKGYYRTRFTGNTKPWSNNVGEGWTHGFNMHLVTSTPIGGKPYTVVLYDEKGMERTYNYSSSDGSLHYYLRNSSGSSRERGYTLVLDGSTGKYYLTMPGGREYHFSESTNDIYRFARLEKIVDISGNELTMDYDDVVGTGKLTKVSPPAGDSRSLQFSYSGNQITKVEVKKSAAVLQTVQYAFNGNNELTKVTDDASNDVDYAYGTYAYAPTSRFVTKITDKAGRDTDFTYTFGYSGGYQATKVDLDNAAGLRTAYDRSISTGVAVATSSKSGTVKNKFGYTPVTGDMSRAAALDYYRYASGNWNTYQRVGYEYDAATKARTKSTMGSAPVQEVSYNSAGRPTSIQCFRAPCGAGTPGGGATGVYYETGSSLYPTKRDGPDGLDIYYFYDSNWRITKVTHPSVAAAGWQVTYDAYGQVITKTDPLGHETTFEYDDTGYMTSVTDPNGSTTTMYYDDYGNVTRVTNPLNKDTYFYYAYGGCGGCGGGGHRLTKIKDALNNESEMHYNGNGDLTKTVDALDGERDFAYDVMGRLTQVTFPSGSGNTATVAYDDLGQVTSQTDFGGKTTTYQYDYLGRVTKASDGVGDIGTSYDALGNVGTITDGNDSTTTYTYDGNNLLTKIIYANGAIVRYFYDTASRMTKRGAGASGTIDAVDFFIDGATGLLTRISYSSGGSSSDVFYAYDGLRRVTKLTDWIDGTDGLRYAYDEAGRLSVLTDYDDSTLTYTYDGAGNVLTMEDYHGSVVTYTYTDTDQVSTITAPGSKVWDYDYNALGHPTSLSIPNGMTTVYGYDVRNRLTKIEHKDGANVLDGSYYDLDDGGSITRKTYPDDEYWDYWYDGRDRLTKAERRDDSDTLLHRYTYTYDVGDNMITKEIYDGTDTDTYVYAHTVANELTKQSFDGTNTMFGYDAWGRMTSRSDGTYSASYYYNYGSKLTKVSSDFPDEGTVEYEYGGNGNRRERSGGGVTTRYNWTSGWSLLNEEDSAGNLLRTYVGDLANVNGSNPSSGSYRYYLHDHLGTVRQVRDQNVLLLSSFESTPFGETYSESGESQSKKYTGHDWDESAKLYYAPFRCYMPGIGKWTVRDPWGTFDGPNLYAYVHADPIGYADRWGLYTVSGDCTSCPYPDGKSYDKTERIKEQTDTWCGDLKNRITDPKLRTCLKDRCDSGKVTCVDGEECKGDEPGERGPLGYCASDPDNRNGWDPETRTWDPTKTSCLKDSPAYICVKNFVPLSSDDSEWGKTVIHEWAHSCGWKHHQTGTGVPPSR